MLKVITVLGFLLLALGRSVHGTHSDRVTKKEKNEATVRHQSGPEECDSVWQLTKCLCIKNVEVVSPLNAALLHYWYQKTQLRSGAHLFFFFFCRRIARNMRGNQTSLWVTLWVAESFCVFESPLSHNSGVFTHYILPQIIRPLLLNKKWRLPF